jgi:hypothetical protein
MTNSRICIYCSRSGSELHFTREHVLQSGFGAFRGALVLSNAVCHECNQCFSTTLDLALTRESVEGLERYRWGVREPSEIQNFRFRSIELTAMELGDFSGTRVRLEPNGDSLKAVPSDGALVPNADDDGFTFLTVEDVLDARWDEASVNWKKGVRLFGDDQTVERMRQVLDARGIRFPKWRPITLPADRDSVQVSQSFVITPAMKRSIAKIAFNYLTFHQGVAFAMLPAFDPIRRYIRYDEPPQTEPIHSSFDTPFRWHHPEQSRPVVHWLGLSAHESHRNLLGTVMLFGFMEHIVILAEDFAGPWFDLPVAHLYNVRSREVTAPTPTIPRWRHPDLI